MNGPRTVDWSDVQVFLEVYRTGTLSAAGRALGVFPSTVGRRLAAFEHTLGTVLFQRTPEGLVPTPVADDVFEGARSMERQAQLIALGLSGEARTLRGRVRVAVTADFASHFLIPRLGEFATLHPEIELDLLTAVGRADLARGEADVAVRFARGEGPPTDGADLDVVLCTRAGTTGIALYASPAYLGRHGVPTRPEDLRNHTTVRPTAGLRFFPGYDWLEENASGGPVSVRAGGMSEVLAAVASGFGIGALPHFMVVARPDVVRLDALGDVEQRSAWVLVPRDLRRVGRVRAVMDFVGNLLRDW